MDNKSITPQTCRKLSILPVCYNLSQAATDLSISLSCNKSVKIRLVLTCHLQTCYNYLLKQLAASPWITSFDNQLETSLLTTCNRLVVNKLSQAMQTHPDVGLFIASLLQLLAVYQSISKGRVNREYPKVRHTSKSGLFTKVFNKAVFPHSSSPTTTSLYRSVDAFSPLGMSSFSFVSGGVRSI